MVAQKNLRTARIQLHVLVFEPYVNCLELRLCIHISVCHFVDKREEIERERGGRQGEGGRDWRGGRVGLYCLCLVEMPITSA